MIVREPIMDLKAHLNLFFAHELQEHVLLAVGERAVCVRVRARAS
jgi:hypothetical protein